MAIPFISSWVNNQSVSPFDERSKKTIREGGSGNESVGYFSSDISIRARDLI